MISVLFPLQAQEVWTLRECVDYAAEQNLTIQQSRISEQLSDVDVESANKQWLPAVSGYLDNSFNIGTNHPAIDKGYVQYSNSFGANSSIVLYQGGLQELNRDRAALTREVARMQTDKVIDDISLMVVNYYLNVMLNRELKQIAEGNLEITVEQLDRSQKLFDAGSIARADLVQAEAEVAQQRKNVADAKIEVDRALFNLAVLLQLPDYRNFDVADIPLPDDIQLGLYDLDAILQTAYTEQPAVKRAELELEVAGKDIEIAKTGSKPVITGSYNLGTSYSDYFNKGLVNDAWLSQWWKNITNVVGVGMNVPIFDRYSKRLNVERSEISEYLAQNSIEQEKQTIRQNVQEAYFNATSSFEAYQAAKESVRSNELAADFAERSFLAGVLNQYDLNIARNNLVVAQAQMAQAKYNFVFRMKVLDFYAGIPLTAGL